MGKIITRYRLDHLRDTLVDPDRSGNVCYSWAKYLLPSRFVPKNLKLNIHNCDFLLFFIGVKFSLSHIKWRTGIRGVREQGAEEEI